MKRKYYLTLDTETATLPFANTLAKTAEEKKKIAIAKPLVYDIGWTITDRQGNEIKAANFLVQETFFVPNVFNTAYYCDKRPIYMELLEQGKIKAMCWNNIMDELEKDMQEVDILAAYNATFDFKKAIPFTEQYISHLYSSDYNEWERHQFGACKRLISSGKGPENPEFLNPYFKFRGNEYPICDLWALACNRLINIDKYRNFCLENGLLTASAKYFKTSAETSYRYLMNKYDFDEDHTALSDAVIESAILAKALKRGKVEPYLEAFPFQNLGTTFDYVQNIQPLPSREPILDTNVQLLFPLAICKQGKAQEEEKEEEGLTHHPAGYFPAGIFLFHTFAL